MAPRTPFRKWTLRTAVAVALILTLPLVGLRGVARADLGDEPSSKSSSSEGIGQADDNDRPKDLLEKKPADAAVAQKKQVDTTPIYEKWQFWAVGGGILVAAVLLGFGTYYLFHSIGGGDVRPCNMMFDGRCFGEGH